MEEQKIKHYAEIELYPRKLTVKYKGNIIAQSEKVMILKESGRKLLNPVFYFPKEDIQADLVMDPEMKGTCPIKGQSNHWNFKEDPTPMYFGWSYETPRPRSREIAGHITFNMKYVTLISEPLSE